MSDVTELLVDAQAGDRRAAAALLPLVYEELRKLAAARMAAESPDHTLQPTALVHEAYLRLVGRAADDHWAGRGHFFGAAAEAMRRILVDAARRKRTVIHGGSLARVPLSEADVPAVELSEDLIALDEALTRLAAIDPIKAQLVTLRHFGGLTIDEAAGAIGISPATAKRYWAYARAWLFRAVAGRPRPEIAPES
jgi:RNA polymerase sigma factor (TIGR02999 family)